MASTRFDEIDLDGASHHVALIEPDRASDGPWLVFLHEGLGSIPQWRDHPSRLCEATGRLGVVYDRRGHGRSAPLPAPRGRDYHTEEARLLMTLVSTLGGDAYVPYGHSDGGTIALLAAALDSTRVAGVITEAAHVSVEQVALDGIRRARKQFSDGPLRDALARHHGDGVDAMFAAWADTWLGAGFAGWSIESDLAAATCPALFIQGAVDEYATPAHLDAVAAAHGGATETWLVPGVGHAPHREAPDRVLARVTDWLSPRPP